MGIIRFKNLYILRIKNGKIILINHQNTPYFIILLGALIYMGLTTMIPLILALPLFILLLFITFILSKIIIDTELYSIKKSYFFLKREIFIFFEYKDFSEMAFLAKEATGHGGDTGDVTVFPIYLIVDAKKEIFLLQFNSLKDAKRLRNFIINYTPIPFKIKLL